MTPIILVDAYNLVFRAFWAYKNLSDAQGRPTSVLYGFLRDVLALKTRGHLIFCWDHGVPGSGRIVKGWRQRLDPTYKANRQKSDDAATALSQIPVLHEQLKVLGFAAVGIPGLEADDLIGLISSTTFSPILIYSSDQDLYQLLDKDRVRVLRPKKEGKDYKIITQDQIEKEYGIPVARWPEFLALGGDTSDNIKAVRGWGPKKAIKLIQAGVDLLLPLEMQPKICREELQVHWTKIKMAYQLAHIPRSWEDARIQAFVKGHESLSYLELQKRRPQPNGVDQFTAFCAAYGLKDFLADRWEFFK